MKLSTSVTRIVMSAAVLFIASENLTYAADSIQQPISAVQVAYEYDSYLNADATQAGQDTLAVADPEKTPQTPATDQLTTGAVEESQESYVADYAMESAPPKPWHIAQPYVFKKYGIDMGGWVQQGITFNNLQPADRFNGPNPINDRDAEYQLNQAWLYFNRPTKTDGCGTDIGGRVDVVYGTDWRFGQCFGLENRFDDMNSFYGLILPQFYGEVAINDLTVKLGHFATFTSLEVVPAPLNFFYSHTLLMGGYFDPLLVTGLQADYKLNDNWTVIGGMNRGWLEFEDPNDTWNFLGGVRWNSDDKRGYLSLMTDNGRQVGFTGLHDRNSVIAVFTYQLNKKLFYGSQYTVGQEVNGSVVNPGQNANWYGTEQLLTLQLNQKWSTGLRYEYVRDEAGSRVAGIGNVMLTDRGWNGLPGCAGSYQDVSLGLNYRPHPNFVFRPEVRWDFYNGEPNPSGQFPYGNHTRTSQFTTAMDLIVTF